MKTIYKSEKLSSGQPWYPTSNKFWVVFSSDISTGLVQSKQISNNTSVFLLCRTYLLEDKEFHEYQFIYYKDGEKVSRKEAAKPLEYKRDFEKLLK